MIWTRCPSTRICSAVFTTCFAKLKPIIGHGGTTYFATNSAAFYTDFKIAHVETSLRTGNIMMAILLIAHSKANQQGTALYQTIANPQRKLILLIGYQHEYFAQGFIDFFQRPQSSNRPTFR